MNREYVRISFDRVGGGRRSTWAIRGSESAAGIIRYTVCDADGGVGRLRRGVDTIEIVLSHRDHVTERPARMNNHYAELEIVR